MRVILVPTADRPECVHALDAAFGLAKALDADVVGCHVRPERSETPTHIAQLMPDDGPALALEDKLTSKAAHALYAHATERHGFKIAKRAVVGRRSLALWHEMVGTPARIFSIVGPVADLAVVSRPKPKSAGRAKAFLMAALLHSARPVLVVPQRRIASFGESIVIAWNQSVEAALAVAAAIPLLRRAQRVVVVSSGPENRAGPKSSYLAQYLGHWDVGVERVRTKGRNVEKEIERVYRDVGGDLLVMGAYSRARFRQLVFGGVTEQMLFKADLPVLMLHR